MFVSHDRTGETGAAELTPQVATPLEQEILLRVSKDEQYIGMPGRVSCLMMLIKLMEGEVGSCTINTRDASALISALLDPKDFRGGAVACSMLRLFPAQIKVTGMLQLQCCVSTKLEEDGGIAAALEGAAEDFQQKFGRTLGSSFALCKDREPVYP